MSEQTTVVPETPEQSEPGGGASPVMDVVVVVVVLAVLAAAAYGLWSLWGWMASAPSIQNRPLTATEVQTLTSPARLKADPGLQALDAAGYRPVQLVTDHTVRQAADRQWVGYKHCDTGQSMEDCAVKHGATATEPVVALHLRPTSSRKAPGAVHGQQFVFNGRSHVLYSASVDDNSAWGLNCTVLPRPVLDAALPPTDDSIDPTVVPTLAKVGAAFHQRHFNAVSGDGISTQTLVISTPKSGATRTWTCFDFLDHL